MGCTAVEDLSRYAYFDEALWSMNGTTHNVAALLNCRPERIIPDAGTLMSCLL
jgi:hypothetical protein